jgi:transposase
MRGPLLVSFIKDFPKPLIGGFTMTATHVHCSDAGPHVLYVAFELSWSDWKLASASAPADNPRLKILRARNLAGLREELAKAKKHFRLPADAAVCSCYEAGRDGFWLHRYLMSLNIHNIIVDSSSIEVQRRGRRAKNDSVDASKLLSMLQRYHGQEKNVWKLVRIPSVEDEDRRQLHRDLLEMKAQRTQHINRIKGLLAGLGLACEVDQHFPEELEQLRTWDGSKAPEGLRQRLLREHARWVFVEQQIRDLETQRRQLVRRGSEAHIARVRKLLGLRGIGINSAWLFVMEVFGWRQIENRRQLGALAGLTPTPYDSGQSAREQGISKAGNRRLRTLAIEIAWCWLHYQPSSHLSQWYRERYGSGNSRMRKIGIVALARKLLVRLWLYLERDEWPEGAQAADWQSKVNGSSQAAAG